ncbi:MAG TPA: enolase C-terminal domain-like protein [Kofleriaceae bacterium]|jgi:O-succinylbenzoate synthase|nr:enolase C-terminal domain-like protein [Kofleriaceae bacterium]
MRIAAIVARTVRWPIAGTGAARGRGERAAVLVEVRSDRGAIGLGEAAPLPGMSPDTLADAEHAIAAFARLAGAELADREAARLLVAATTAPPAARFALETALFDALAREHGITLAALLRAPGRGPGTAPDPHVGAKPSLPATTAGGADLPRAHADAGAPVPTRASGLLDTTGPRVGAMPRVPLAAVVDNPDAARRAFAAGIRCLKIKLGADDPLDRVRAIAAAVPGATLRIDANRSWPPAEVLDRLAALAALPIEYVEEPCRDAHRLLAGPLPCKLALDESLIELSADELATALRSPALAALILKPALLGGLSACLALAAQAGAFGVAAVASHTLEGPIGTAACAELALALAADDASGTAAGLAPHPALAGWRLPVAQLAADHLHPAAAPGLGFVDLDLAGALRALEPAR